MPVESRSQSTSSQGASGGGATQYDSIRAIQINSIVDVRLEEKLASILDKFRHELVKELGEDVSSRVAQLQVEFKSSIASFKETILDLQNSANFVSAETTALRKDLDMAVKEVKVVKAELKIAQSISKAARGIVNDMEVSAKATNLVLYGLGNDRKGVDAEIELKKFLKNEPIYRGVDIDSILFRNVFRMGAPKDRPRPVKIQLVRMADKQKLFGLYLSNRQSFIDRGFRMRDDLPREDRLFRSAAFPLFQKLFLVPKTPRFVQGGASCDGRTFDSIEKLRDYVNSFVPVVPDIVIEDAIVDTVDEQNVLV